MAPKTIEALTTPEMLDALAERVRDLRAELEAARNGSVAPPQPARTGDVHCCFPVSGNRALTPEALRVRMEYAGLSRTGFSEVFGIPLEMVQEWLSGERPIPDWVLTAIHIFELLTPSERRRLARRPAGKSTRNPAKMHPFARIEEL